VRIFGDDEFLSWGRERCGICHGIDAENRIGGAHTEVLIDLSG